MGTGFRIRSCASKDNRMASFKHGEVEIAFLDEGAGEPIVLAHGVDSTKEVNWVNPGWVRALPGAGRRAIALDNRGQWACVTRIARPLRGYATVVQMKEGPS